MSTSFNIVVPFYNVEKWITRCIRSIRAQNYQNYKVVLVNDESDDNTIDVIKKEIKNDDRFSLIHTEQRGGALNSTVRGIDYLKPADEDVIIVLDGDDWFAGQRSLDTVNKTYVDNNCLMTYGSYIEYPSGMRGKFSREVPREILRNKLFRESAWMTSHLRTFKYKLWRHIKKEDIVDSNGKIYAMAGDLPVMFPMLEMAEERSHFIKDIIHVYNRSNPLNEDKDHLHDQIRCALELFRKPAYSQYL